MKRSLKMFLSLATVLVIVGFLIMVISVLPGAQFWFGLLSKLGTLRSTGPKPASSTASSS